MPASTSHLTPSSLFANSIFENTPIAIWEEDFSAIKQHLEELKKEGVTDFRVYFTAHPEAVYEYIAMMRIMDVNKATVQMYQAESKDALREGMAQLFTKGEWRNYCEDLICVAEGRTGNSWEGSDETFTGKPIQISLNWSVAPDHEDDFSKVIVTTIDITERKQAEKKIAQQLERLTALREIDQFITSTFDQKTNLGTIIEHATVHLGADAVAVMLLDPFDESLKYSVGRGFRSRAFEQGSPLKMGEGYAGRAALKRSSVYIKDLPTQNDNPRLARHLETEGFIQYFGVPLIVKDKVKGVMEVFLRTPAEPDQEWLNFLETLAGQAAIAIDNAQLWEQAQRHTQELEQRVARRTEELNQTNSELERANRTKDEFLANMSHELRTPLNSILGLSESLLEERLGSLNDRQQKSLEIIRSSGRHLLELINDILDLSKIEAGNFDFYPQPVSVDELCRSSLTFIKAQAAKKSITVTYTNESSISTIFADSRRLKQILVNLLTNAVKFTPENGLVVLQVNDDLEQERIQFSVIDNGIGISPQDLQRLFQPFVQVDSDLNRRYQGTGLGLAIVQKLTDLHGGSVHVESEVGKGSRFSINLACKPEELAKRQNPLPKIESQANQQSEKHVSGSGDAVHRPAILLAEDNMPNILTIGEYLESHGYEVITAHDGLDAITKAGEMKPDLILMDIQMPVMNGLEAIARLRADHRFASTPIIALTALAMPGDRERCIAAGANEYMSKPVSLKSLIKTVRSLL